MTARTGIASVTAKIAIPKRSLGDAETQRSGNELLESGPASEAAAPSIFQDGPAGDHHNRPIAEGRHCGAYARGDDAPARPVPVLDAAYFQQPKCRWRRWPRSLAG